jgi:hypothetical protein
VWSYEKKSKRWGKAGIPAGGAWGAELPCRGRTTTRVQGDSESGGWWSRSFR